MMPTTLLVVSKWEMIRLLHGNHAFSDGLWHMLVRNARLESNPVDQLFNSSERWLARVPLLLGRYGNGEKAQRLPRVSQTLAEMVGTTRTCVNFFMKKFKKLGFIEYSVGLKSQSIRPPHQKKSKRTCQSLEDNFNTFVDSIHPEGQERVAGVMARKHETGARLAR